MSEVTLEKVIAEIDALNQESLRQLRQVVDEKLQRLEQATSEPTPNKLPVPRFLGYTAPPKDRTKEYEWLRAHRQEYLHQWVALDDDNLLAHGKKFKEVIETARQKGVPDALMIFVEPPDAPPFVLW
ncbi:MAG: DUF5678 domain-containing protein [Acidobacteriota bacterium]